MSGEHKCDQHCKVAPNDFVDYSLFYQNCPTDVYKNNQCILKNLELAVYLDKIKETIQELFQSAFNHNGELIGGIVKNYIVPLIDLEVVQQKSVQKEANFSTQCGYQQFVYSDYQHNSFVPSLVNSPGDIDIWVPSVGDHDKIIQELIIKGFTIRPCYYRVYDDSIDRLYNDHINPVVDCYNVPLYRYCIKKNDVKFEVDFLVSTTFPTNDFSVNLLAYNGYNLKYHSYHSLNNDQQLNFTMNDILQQIKTKTTYILPPYCTVETNEEVAHRRHFRVLGMIQLKKYKIVNLQQARQAFYNRNTVELFDN